MQFRLLFAISLSSILVACKTQQHSTSNYLQTEKSATTQAINIPEPVIQRNDHLSIKVYSLSSDPRTDMPYNLPEQTVIGSSNTTATAGFLVDQDGNIEYPRIGTLHVAGKTKTEVAKEIRERLDTVLKSPTVIVRFLNYKVTVLGEVRAPGTFTLPTERITILEALGLAGDITDYGSKDSVKIAREKNDQVELGYVDLTSKDFFNSPYYRLQQNDVVFVQQNRRKVEEIEIREEQRTAQRITLVTGIVTTVALIFNILRR